MGSQLRLRHNAEGNGLSVSRNNGANTKRRAKKTRKKADRSSQPQKRIRRATSERSSQPSKDSSNNNSTMAPPCSNANANDGDAAVAAAAAAEEEQERLNRVYRLLAARVVSSSSSSSSSGRRRNNNKKNAAVTDDDLEAAVQDLFRPPPPPVEPAAAAARKKEEEEEEKEEEDDSDEAAAATKRKKQQRTNATSTVATTTTTAAGADSASDDGIVEDDEDYDNDDEEEEEAEAGESGNQKPATAVAPPVSGAQKKRRRRGGKAESTDGNDDGQRNPRTACTEHDYDGIPFGRQGAYMVTSFGDGPNPLPESVGAALRGCRLLLQTAIRDARCVRRDQQSQFVRATLAATASRHKKKKREQIGSSYPEDDHDDGGTDGSGRRRPRPRVEPLSAEMMFRATSVSTAGTGTVAAGPGTGGKKRKIKTSRAYDPLVYAPACGFGVEELDALFPEEMNAYRRWNEMESSANPENDTAAKAAAKADGDEDEVDDDDDDEDEVDGAASTSADDNKKADVDIEGAAANVVGGHFAERMNQFDVRTDRMKKEWYLVFSDLRQGSFLPRRIGKKTSQSDRDWESKQGPKKRGRMKDGTWGNLPAMTVRFLHWVGFEPLSALPPPNEDTAQALAYLGHDFVGRIVEKAIQLKKPNSDIVELTNGEQLTESDIERAMADPEIKPTPLYSADGEGRETATAAVPQLYFGPGFEDRLEMELEEMMGSKDPKDVPARERKIRLEEEALFAKLAAAPPPVDSVKSLLEKAATAPAPTTAPVAGDEEAEKKKS